MPVKLKNLVKLTATSPTGATGSYTITGTVSGFRPVRLLDGEQAYFEADDGSGNTEVFKGTYTAVGTTVSRDICLDSTNSDTFISWGSTTSVTLRIVGVAESNNWMHPGYIAGKHYHNLYAIANGPNSYAHGVLGGSRLALSFYPIFEVCQPANINCVLGVAGSSGALIRMGIFENFKGRPGDLIYDATTIAGDVGSNAIKSLPISGVVLKPPGAWLAICGSVPSGTMPDVRFFNGTYAGQAVKGLPAGSDTYTALSTFNLYANDGTDYSGGLPSSLKTATFTDPGSQDPAVWLGF